MVKPNDVVAIIIILLFIVLIIVGFGIWKLVSVVRQAQGDSSEYSDISTSYASDDTPPDEGIGSHGG
jgi:predicted negative regulator of RcsB-dependent stress response